MKEDGEREDIRGERGEKKGGRGKRKEGEGEGGSTSFPSQRYRRRGESA